jgi:hypothetical protein
MEEAAIGIILPVLEAAVIYASNYCKACGRSTVTSKDMEYGLKYAAMTTVGKHIGSHFPEEDDEDSDGSLDDDSVEVVDDDEEEPFTRYEGSEEIYVQMNNAYDTWDSWEPSSPAEQAIKNAIEKQESDGRVYPE